MKRFSRGLLNALLITLGILSASMGLHGFLLSSNFIDGGVTGISMLASKVTGTSLSIWIAVANLPFIALGYKQIGAALALRSAAGIGGLSLSLATIHFPDVTPDRLLTAVFGGFFIGVIHGIEEYTAITIVSRMSGEIAAQIMANLGRGVTIYKGRGGLSFEDQDILYCVVTRLEIGKVKTIVHALDQSAFVTSHPLSGVDGGMLKRASLY